MGKDTKSSHTKATPDGAGNPAPGMTLPPPSYTSRGPGQTGSAGPSIHSKGGGRFSGGEESARKSAHASQSQRPTDHRSSQPPVPNFNENNDSHNSHDDHHEGSADRHRNEGNQPESYSARYLSAEPRRGPIRWARLFDNPLWREHPGFYETIFENNSILANQELEIVEWWQVSTPFAYRLQRYFPSSLGRIKGWFHEGRIFKVRDSWLMPFGVFPLFPPSFQARWLEGLAFAMRDDPFESAEYQDWLEETGYIRWLGW